MVLRANELRIGNWIYEFGIPQQVIPLWIVNLSQIEQANKICIDLTPIPLTEERLLKFGFVINDVESCGCIMPLPENHIKFSSPRWITHSFGSIGHSKKLDIPFLRFDATHTDVYYVHHLQNFYYALTGIELETAK